MTCGDSATFKYCGFCTCGSEPSATTVIASPRLTVSRVLGKHLIFDQGKGVEALFRKDHETDVDPPLFQPLDDLSIRSFIYMHFDARMRLAIALQNPWQQFDR